MVVVRLKGVKVYKAKGKTYAYHRATGRRLQAEIGTAAFFAEVAEMDAKAAATKDLPEQPGTVGEIFGKYRASPEFKGLAERTRNDYQKVLDWLAPWRDVAAHLVDKPTLIQARNKAIDQKGRRFGNYVVQVVRLVWGWAGENLKIKLEPLVDIKLVARPKQLPDANRPWADHELTAVLDACPAGLRLAVLMRAYAGPREEDAVRMAWSAYNPAVPELRWRQGKTGDEVAVPLHSDLWLALETAPRISPVIVTGQRGRPLTPSGFRAMFFRIIRKLEAESKVAPGLTFLGLRHTVATNLAELGVPTEGIAAVLGQRSLVMAQFYSERAKRKAHATAAIAKLDSHRKK